MMILDSLSPYIRVAMDDINTEPWFIQERVLFDYELLYVMEGELLVTIEEEIYEGRQGDIFLFRPGQRHSLRKTSPKLRQPHIHFDFFYQEDSPGVKVSFRSWDKISEEEKHWFREDIMDQMPVPLSSHLRLKNPLLIEQMLIQLINEFDLKMPFFEIKIKGLFIQLWIQILRENYWNLHPHLITNFQTLLKVKDFLMNTPERKVTLEEISKMSGISKHYLIRLFKKAFGMSPLQYHQFIRIQRAKHLIQFTEDSIDAIAEKMGYPNIHAFSRAFKTVDGIHPSFYRN
ncbi:AraC family transcriptional regulator [uncultured Paenibacillus sp.]|uniref:AraC family transcriptional regulator n=1 Tax=uncultured Paenibacillus sp. TaxID=227322 RepID=UPI0028047B78|nr:AraC family transcriptional regulator [uncultured Paenibacillus sp.]